jgi:hypothetical protein
MALSSDLSKFLGTSFHLHLDLKIIDQFLILQIKKKLRYWNFAHLSLVGRTLFVNQVLWIICANGMTSFLTTLLGLWKRHTKSWGCST